MAARTLLAEQYVRFSVEGLQKAEADVTQTVTRVSGTWRGLGSQVAAGAGRFGSGILGAFKGIAAVPGLIGQAGSLGLTAFARTVSFVKAGLSAVAAGGMAMARGLATLGSPAASLLSFARVAAQGTREGQQFAVAWEYAGRSIGQMFAPAMRTAAVILVRIGDAWARLNPEVKFWIVLASLAAVATTALIAAVTLLSVGFNYLAVSAGIAWAIVTAPVTLIALGILAIAAAVALVTGYLVEFLETGQVGTKSWIAAMLSGVRVFVTQSMFLFNMLLALFSKFIAFTTTTAASAFRAMGMDETAKMLETINKLAQRGISKLILPQFQVDQWFKDAEKWIEQNVPAFSEVGKWLKSAPGRVRDIASLVRQLLGGGPLGKDMQFHPLLDVRFEGLQESFDRLQQAFAQGSPQDQLGQIRDNGKETNNILDKILNKIGLGGAAVGP